MKIKELIKQLKGIEKQYGDLEIVFEEGRIGYSNIESVGVEKGNIINPFICVIK